jgi:hypothetical protein
MKEQIQQICDQVKHSIQINHTQAKLNLDNRSNENHIKWWSEQVEKWSITWQQFSQIAADADDSEKLMLTEALSDTTFMEYENLYRQTMSLEILVPLRVIKIEARKWRNTGVYLAMIHKCNVFRAIA